MRRSSTAKGRKVAQSAAVSLCCVFVLVFAIASHAQMSPFFNDFDNTLNGDDMKDIIATGQRLYGQNTVPDGASDKWFNPKTGNGGTITVLQSFTRDGMQCRKVRYENQISGLQGARTYTLNWCKTSAGDWKMV